MLSKFTLAGAFIVANTIALTFPGADYIKIGTPNIMMVYEDTLSNNHFFICSSAVQKNTYSSPFSVVFTYILETNAHLPSSTFTMAKELDIT